MIDGRRRRPTEGQIPSARSQALKSFGSLLVRLGVSANAVTAVGVVLAAGTGVTIGLGHLWIGTALLIVGGLMDTLDGVVAKAAGTTGPRGAFCDSVADRLADALIFGGVTWHLLSGHDPRLALLPVAILAVSALVSYERAKAESLGFTAHGGLMERAERLILLGAALVFHVVIVPILVLLLALTCLTAAGRFIRVFRQATVVPAVPTVPPLVEARSGRLESTWRAARERRRQEALRQRRRTRRARQPIAFRLRDVLHQDRDWPLREVRRERAGRQRAAAALRRRIDSER
jgi:CDP-diacylglycerol--glycerol-3-phosphate 3-phosphatidyltransferase